MPRGRLQRDQLAHALAMAMLTTGIGAWTAAAQQASAPGAPPVLPASPAAPPSGPLATAPAATELAPMTNAGSAPPTGATLGEIVVTAQKRTQRLQDVPISVSVVSGATLNDFHITDLQTLQTRVPNMTVLTSGVDPVVYIRGFGSGPNNVGFDQEVSIYSDGIYGGRGAQFTAPFFDVARVEVLRGPQGALFGKNTAAGAISIVSAGPTGDFEASGTTDYNFIEKGYDLSGFVSGPVTDSFGLRFAFKAVDEDGYIHNLATGKHDPETEQQLARLTFKWDPTSKLDVTGKLEYGRDRVDGGINESESLTGAQDYRDYRYADSPYGPSPVGEENSITSKNAELTVNYSLPAGLTLTSVSGLSNYWTSRLAGYDEIVPDTGAIPPNNDNALLGNAFPEHFTQYSEEIRLLSPTGHKLEYVMGAYVDYSHFRLEQDTWYAGIIGGLLTGHQSTNFDQNARTYSAFGQGTYHLLPQLRLIASLRYSATLKEASFTSHTVSGQALQAITSANGDRNEGSIDPSGTIQYDLARHVMVYGTIARGTKSGGFVSNTYGTTNADFEFEPERSTNYEAGVKSTFLNGRVVANATVFDTKFTNLQQSAFDPTTQLFITANAASASSKGVELDLQWLPIRSLQLTLGAAYTDAKFDNFPGAQCVATQTVAQCNPAAPASNNLKGYPLLYAPKWSGDFSAQHTLDVANDYRLTSIVSLAYKTRYYVSDDYSPVYGVQGGFVKVDARLQFGPRSGRWDVAVVGKNLTDVRTVGESLDFPGAITTNARAIAWLDEFRSVMIEGQVRF